MRVVSGHVRDASLTCKRPGIGPEGSVLRSSFRCVTSTPGYRRNPANAALSVIASNCPPFTAQRVFSACDLRPPTTDNPRPTTDDVSLRAHACARDPCPSRRAGDWVEFCLIDGQLRATDHAGHTHLWGGARRGRRGVGSDAGVDREPCQRSPRASRACSCLLGTRPKIEKCQNFD